MNINSSKDLASSMINNLPEFVQHGKVLSYVDFLPKRLAEQRNKNEFTAVSEEAMIVFDHNQFELTFIYDIHFLNQMMKHRDHREFSTLPNFAFLKFFVDMAGENPCCYQAINDDFASRNQISFQDWLQKDVNLWMKDFNRVYGQYKGFTPEVWYSRLLEQRKNKAS